MSIAPGGDVMTLAIIVGACCLLIGLMAGIKWERRPGPNADARRELRRLRGESPTDQSRAMNPNPPQPNLGDYGAGF
jgi:hypothetical protein